MKLNNEYDVGVGVAFLILIFQMIAFGANNNFVLSVLNGFGAIALGNSFVKKRVSRREK